MDSFIQYSPIILVVLIFLIQSKIFVRSDDFNKKAKENGYMTSSEFQKKRAEFQKYIADNYISKEIYFYNHNDLKQETADIKETLNKIDNKIENRNIEDRKMLLEIMQTLANKNN